MRHQGTLRVALAFAALLGSLSLVIWRQSRALEMLRELDSLRSARAVLESERSRVNERIQHLESRARIMEETGARWGMHVPGSGEAVVLRLRPEPPAPREPGGLRIAAANAGKGNRD
jgi:hypothetical protein